MNVQNSAWHSCQIITVFVYHVGSLTAGSQMRSGWLGLGAKSGKWMSLGGRCRQEKSGKREALSGYSEKTKANWKRTPVSGWDKRDEDHRQEMRKERVPSQQRIGVAREGFPKLLRVLPCARNPTDVIRLTSLCLFLHFNWEREEVRRVMKSYQRAESLEGEAGYV